jgi:hypothetical protein
LLLSKAVARRFLIFTPFKTRVHLVRIFLLRGGEGAKKMFYARAAQEAFPGQNSKKASGIIPDFYDQRVKSLFPDQGFPK